MYAGIHARHSFENYFHIDPLEDELFLADRRTDMTKLTAAFSSFANAAENVYNSKRQMPSLIYEFLFIQTQSKR